MVTGIVPLKMKIWCKCTHPQAIQDVDEFVSSLDLEKGSIMSLAQQWDPLQWMGAVRMRVQTADKNIHDQNSSFNIIINDNVSIYNYLFW